MRFSLRQLPWLGAALGLLAAVGGLEGCGRQGASASTDIVGNVRSMVFAKRANYGPDGSPVVAGGTDQVIDYLRYVPGGGVYTLTPPRPDGKLEQITAGYTTADVNGLDVSFDAQHVVFSMKTKDSDKYHIYLATLGIGPDGTHGIRQLTFGPRDDVMPIFVPGDRIAFVSNEPYTPMGTRADEYEHAAIVSQITTVTVSGGDADRRSCAQNLSHTVNLFLRSDGTIGFSRWEHLGDVNDVKLFKMNPDCTQMLAVAGQHDKPMNSIIQVSEIAPNVMVGIGTSRNKTLQAGAIFRVTASTPDGRPDEEHTTWENLSPGVPTESLASPVGRYKNPAPLGDGRLVVSWADGWITPQNELDQVPPNFGLYVFDPATAKNQLIYDDPHTSELYAKPATIRAEPNIRYDVNRPNYALPGEIGSIDITQTSLDEPVDGAQFANTKLKDALTQAVKVRVIEGFSSEIGAAPMFGLTMHEGAAVLGEATVQADGSWGAKVPAYIPMHLQPIDKFGLAIRSQGLWIQTMPGEQRRCGGCHESRTDTILPRRGSGLTLAQTKGPESFAVPVPDRVKNEYAWDKVIQPILDAKCVSCHGAGSALAQKTYQVIATDQMGKQTTYTIPWLNLEGTPMTVSYDKGYYQFTTSYVSVYYPAALEMGARGLRVVGELPKPAWMYPASARHSRLIKDLNPMAADGTLAWAGLAQHGKTYNFTLTPDEMGAFIKSADLGGQFTSRQNVKSATCWAGAGAEMGLCGNGSAGKVYP